MKKKMMLSKLLLTALAALSISFAQAQTPGNPVIQKLYVNGSEAMFPAVNALGNTFKNQYQFAPNLDVKILGQGSTLGLAALLEGHSNLATSTRKITKQEADEFKSAKIVLKEFVVAKEALTIVVSKSNPVYKLTYQEVTDIFSGKITNWKDVGGEDQPIKLFIRSNTSGCYEGFKDMFFKQSEDYASNALQLGSNNDIKKNLTKYSGGVSFLGYNSAVVQSGDVKVLKISIDGENYVQPGQMTIDDGSYKLTRLCYVYVKETDYANLPQLKAFIEFLMTAKSADVWEDNGFSSVIKK